MNYELLKMTGSCLNVEASPEGRTILARDLSPWKMCPFPVSARRADEPYGRPTAEKLKRCPPAAEAAGYERTPYRAKSVHSCPEE